MNKPNRQNRTARGGSLEHLVRKLTDILDHLIQKLRQRFSSSIIIRKDETHGVRGWVNRVIWITWLNLVLAQSAAGTPSGLKLVALQKADILSNLGALVPDSGYSILMPAKQVAFGQFLQIHRLQFRNDRFDIATESAPSSFPVPRHRGEMIDESSSKAPAKTGYNDANDGKFELKWVHLFWIPVFWASVVAGFLIGLWLCDLWDGLWINRINRGFLSNGRMFPNDRTERRGRPSASALAADAARPRSLQ